MIGEIKSTREINKVGTGKYIWQACADCGLERWVQLVRGRPRFDICHLCSGGRRRGENNWNWKGGRVRTKHGYILIRLYPDDFFYPMTDKRGCAFEHRLVMARFLGRCLHPWELIHHKNHIRDDNNLENLQLVSDLGHKQIIQMEKRIKQLEKEVAGLKGMLARYELLVEV